MGYTQRMWMNRILKKVDVKDMAPGLKHRIKKCMPNNDVVSEVAKRGLFGGRHIQYGNKISARSRSKTRRTWEVNVHSKRLYSYIMDSFIRVNVSTHVLYRIDNCGGIDEYLLRTPYNKMDTDIGLFWKAKVEKMYEELAQMDVVFFTPEVEAKLAERFKEVQAERASAWNKFRREMYGDKGKINLSKGDGPGLVPVSYILDSTDRKQAKPYKPRSQNFGEAGRIVLNY